MSDLDMFLAKTQARLAFFFGDHLSPALRPRVIAILLLSTNVNQTVSNLLVQVVTGVLALAGTACGFFYARTRQGGIPDANVITQTHTMPDGTTTKITSPVGAAIRRGSSPANHKRKFQSGRIRLLAGTGATIAAAPLAQTQPEKKIVTSPLTLALFSFSHSFNSSPVR